MASTYPPYFPSRRPDDAARIPTRWLDVTPRESTDVPCELESLSLEARIRGVHAEVTQTIVVRNPNWRPISASFALPLPDDAVVCGYALDIDGELREGVVVEKEHARVAFETEQRRGADPGLVEAVRGNVYRTRVYPVPPRGTRTLQLSYVTPLLVAQGASAALDLSMPAERLAHLSVDIEVELLDCPTPVISGLGNLPLEVRHGSWVAHHEDRDVAPGSDLRVALPVLPDSFALLERDDEGTTWFVVSERVVDADPGKVEPPVSLTVLWDASGSRAGIDHADEFALIRAWCASGSLTALTLVVFADRVWDVTNFETADDLVAYLRELRYDGGTDLGALAAALDGLASQQRVCALFTDGLDTLSGEPFSLARDWETLAVVSGTERDAEALRQACRGLVFDLVTAPADAHELARCLRPDSPLRTLDVDGEGFADVCSLPAAGIGRATVLGRLTGDEACVTLGTGTELRLDASDARAGTTLAHAWAARRITQLSARASDNRTQLLELGRRFGIASPETSLIVLESLDQWLRHDIEPPRSWGSMHEAWRRHKDGEMRHGSRRGRADAHRRDLELAWASLLAWWNEDHGARQPRIAGGSEAFGTVFCEYCGFRIKPGHAYCMRCGRLHPYGNELFSHASPLRTLPGVPVAGSPGDTGVLFELSALADGAAPSPVEGALSLAEDMAAPTEGAPSRAEDMPSPAEGAPSPAGDGNPRHSLWDRMRMATAHFRTAPRDDVPARAAMAMPMMAASASAPDGMRFTAAFAEEAFADAASPVAMNAASGVDLGAATPAGGAVSIRAWTPDTPYLAALDRAADGDGAGTSPGSAADRARQAYFEARREYQGSPAFFLDCAGWFIEHGDEDFGVRVLTNLAELRIEDAALLRVLGWRLREAGRLELALTVFQRVLGLRREDAQSHRDLALVLEELARRDFAAGHALRAAGYALGAGSTLRHLALTPWNRRALALALFAVEEYNVLRAWVDAQEWPQPPQLEPLGPELEGVLACDLRVTLAWDADETDVDIHVTEPSGEEAYYAHRRTDAGGRVSEDITDGYGPELYEIRRAEEGTYRIRAHYFASHQQAVFGPATCTLTVFTDWGRPEQTQRITTIRLDQEKEMVDVGTASYERREGAREDAADESLPLDQIHVGMDVAKVVPILGMPADVNASATSQAWEWRLAGNARLVVTFDLAGTATRVVRRLADGTETEL